MKGLIIIISVLLSLSLQRPHGHPLKGHISSSSPNGAFWWLDSPQSPFQKPVGHVGVERGDKVNIEGHLEGTERPFPGGVVGRSIRPSDSGSGPGSSSFQRRISSEALLYPGCPASLFCVPEDRCNAQGILEPGPIVLSRAERHFRVPLVGCSMLGTGNSGVCCRDKVQRSGPSSIFVRYNVANSVPVPKLNSGTSTSAVPLISTYTTSSTTKVTTTPEPTTIAMTTTTTGTSTTSLVPLIPSSTTPVTTTSKPVTSKSITGNANSTDVILQPSTAFTPTSTISTLIFGSGSGGDQDSETRSNASSGLNPYGPNQEPIYLISQDPIIDLDDSTEPPSTAPPEVPGPSTSSTTPKIPPNYPRVPQLSSERPLPPVSPSTRKNPNPISYSQLYGKGPAPGVSVPIPAQNYVPPPPGPSVTLVDSSKSNSNDSTVSVGIRGSFPTRKRWVEVCPLDMKCLRESHCAEIDPREGNIDLFDIRLGGPDLRIKCKQGTLPVDGVCCYLREDYVSGGLIIGRGLTASGSTTKDQSHIIQFES